MTEALRDELAAVRAELTRVDQKCGTLAGLAGAAAAFLATQVTGSAPNAERVILALAGLILAAATMLLLAGVLRPRLGTTGFRYWARLDPTTIAEQVTKPGASVRLGTADLQTLAKICDAKYTRLRWAVDLIIGAVGLIGVGLVVGIAS